MCIYIEMLNFLLSALPGGGGGGHYVLMLVVCHIAMLI